MKNKKAANVLFIILGAALAIVASTTGCSGSASSGSVTVERTTEGSSTTGSANYRVGP